MILNLARLLELSGNSAYSYYLSVRLFCAYADPEGSFLTRSRHLIDNHYIFDLQLQKSFLITQENFSFHSFPQILYHGKN